MFWFLLLVVAVLVGLFFFSTTRERLKGTGMVVFEVSAESIKAFEARVSELEQSAALLRNRLQISGPIQRVLLTRRLEILDARIGDLKATIANWRSARDARSATALYRQCLLLYGKASGICEALAVDTLSD